MLSAGGQMGAAKDKDGLTAKQRRFAELLADGLSQADAWRGAYDASRMSDAALHTAAWRLASRAEITQRVEAILTGRRAVVAAKTLPERDRVIALLRTMALDDGKPDHTRLRAAELWGRAVGAFIDAPVATATGISDTDVAALQARLQLLVEHDSRVVAVQSAGDGNGEGEPLH